MIDSRHRLADELLCLRRAVDSSPECEGLSDAEAEFYDFVYDHFDELVEVLRG